MVNPADVQRALDLCRQGRTGEAIPHLQRHLREHPQDEPAWLQLARCFLRQANWEAALQCAAEADRIRPSEQALDIALECLGTLGRADDVEHTVQAALARYPDSVAMQAHYGTHLHRQGRVSEGLRLQPMIRRRFSPQRPGDDRIAATPWDGARFDGVLLVSSEQGLGEEILASSFFRLLVKLGQPAVIECDARLLPIFTRSFPALRFWPPHPGNEQRLRDEGTPVRRVKTLDLAPLLIGEGEFRQPARWLYPDAQRVESIRARYRAQWPGRFLLGVSWRSVRDIRGTFWKSLSLDNLLPVLALPDVVALDVQYGGTAEERQIPTRHGLPPLAHDRDIDPYQDLDGLMAQLCVLDAVVTVSNTTAHIAGAAGIAADVILPPQPPTYVYWGYDGERTPMYPSLRLWRPWQFTSPDELAVALARDIATRRANGKE